MSEAIWAAVYAHYWCQAEPVARCIQRANEAVRDWMDEGSPAPSPQSVERADKR